MTQKGMKFRVKDEAHSAAIQEKLFEMGCGWRGDDFLVKWPEEPYLYANGKFLTYGNNTKDFFEEDESTEHILTEDGEIVPLVHENLPATEPLQETKQEPPVTLRPQKEMWLDRAAELLAAMSLCVDNQQKIPYEWIEELANVNVHL